MKKALYNIIVILLFAVFCGFLVLGNVFRVSVPVVTVPGSYAEQYAEKNHLNQVSAPDTLAAGTELRYETFSFNASGNSVSLEKYNGIGEEIVIPQKIAGKTVVAIGEHFFSDSASVKTVFLPNTVTEIQAEPVSGVTLTVNAGSALEEGLENAGWNVSTYNDSDAPIFTLGDIPFEYNETAAEIELAAYTGKERSVLIPAYIDGKPVTAVAFNMISYDLVAFPATVQSITGETSVTLYTRAFAVELIFTILAFLSVLIVLNVKIPKLRRNEEYVLTGPQIVLSFLFLIAQITFALLVIYKGIVSWSMALLISAILLALYFILLLMAGTGRRHAVAVTQNTAVRTSFMDDLKLSVVNLEDGIQDRDLKKQVTRVLEEIRFSDPTSNDASGSIEQELKAAVGELKSAITSGKTDMIRKSCETTMQLILRRNEICKRNK